MVFQRLSLAAMLLLSVILGFFVGFGFLTLASHYQTAKASSSQFSRFAYLPEHAVSDSPILGQAAIDQAMAMFQLRLPRNAEWPLFDGELSDRGLTVKSSWLEKSRVSIGPSAFSSWAMLGSTLAHEIEVHCQQNFPLIFLGDKLGFKGSFYAEREAYEYEIRNAARFGLSEHDKNLIAATMDYYYPIGK